MKKKAKKLRLAKETLATLAGDRLKKVPGALWCSAPNATCSCDTTYSPGASGDASCMLACASYEVC